MKRGIMLSIAASLVLTACGSTEPKPAPQTGSGQQKEESAIGKELKRQVDMYREIKEYKRSQREQLLREQAKQEQNAAKNRTSTEMSGKGRSGTTGGGGS